MRPSMPAARTPPAGRSRGPPVGMGIIGTLANVLAPSRLRDTLVAAAFIARIRPSPSMAMVGPKHCNLHGGSMVAKSVVTSVGGGDGKGWMSAAGSLSGIDEEASEDPRHPAKTV